jgi:hypothetical protein
MPFIRLRLPRDPERALVVRDRISAQFQNEGRQIYAPAWADWVEVHAPDEGAARMVFAQVQTESVQARPPSARSVAHGRTRLTTLTQEAVPVHNPELMRPWLPEGDNSNLTGKLSMQRSLGLLRRRLGTISDECAYLDAIVSSNGLVLEQASLLSEPLSTVPVCSTPWQEWAKQHQGTVKKAAKGNQATTFVITREAAQASRDRYAHTYTALAAAVAALEQQIATMPTTLDPVQAFALMLSRVKGYQRFRCTQGGQIIANSKPVFIDGIAMGEYEVSVSAPQQMITLRGGMHNVDGYNHPHVYLGSP